MIGKVISTITSCSKMTSTSLGNSWINRFATIRDSTLTVTAITTMTTTVSTVSSMSVKSSVTPLPATTITMDVRMSPMRMSPTSPVITNQPPFLCSIFSSSFFTGSSRSFFLSRNSITHTVMTSMMSVVMSMFTVVSAFMVSVMFTFVSTVFSPFFIKLVSMIVMVVVMFVMVVFVMSVCSFMTALVTSMMTTFTATETITFGWILFFLGVVRFFSFFVVFSVSYIVTC